MLEAIYLIFNVTFICICWAWVWIMMSAKLLQRTLNRGPVLLLLFLSILTHIPYNIYIMYNVNATPTGTYLWEFAVGVLDAVFLIAILYRCTHIKISRIISSVTLSYCIQYTFFILEALVVQDFILKIALGKSGLVFYLLNTIGNVLIYIIVLLYSWILRILCNKSHFPTFFATLFHHRWSSITTCIFCLILMQWTRIAAFLFPEFQASLSYYMIFAAINICILLALLFVAIFETNRLRVKEQNTFILQQESYVASLEKLQTDMRAFRHDYQNLMNSMYLQASEGDLEGIQQIVRNKVTYFDHQIGTELRHMSQLAALKNPEVKSLILVKQQTMEQERITFNLEVLHPVQKLGMDTDDFIRCLGILLDNAMEAAVAAPTRYVDLLIAVSEKELSLVIQNPVKQKPQLSQIIKRGYSTKGENRGIGLDNYHKIVCRYKNVSASTSCDETLFRQELKIAL